MREIRPARPRPRQCPQSAGPVQRQGAARPDSQARDGIREPGNRILQRVEHGPQTGIPPEVRRALCEAAPTVQAALQGAQFRHQNHRHGHRRRRSEIRARPRGGGSMGVFRRRHCDAPRTRQLHPRLREKPVVLPRFNPPFQKGDGRTRGKADPSLRSLRRHPRERLVEGFRAASR